MALTADRIVTLACQIAKCPGFTTQAQEFLNLVLEDLAQNYDFPSAAYTFHNFAVGPNSGTGTGTPTGQWYNLELPASSVLVQNNATYLRTHAVFYSVSGSIFYLNQLPLDKYDQLFQGQGISNYPYWYVVDPTGSPYLATIQMAFYPPPNLSLSLTIRNQYQPNAITTAQFAAGNVVPWFPNQNILITATAYRLMQITGDQRLPQYHAMLYGDPKHPGDNGMIGKYLLMVGDKENYAVQVKLDPLLFRSVTNLKPTKTTGFAWVTGFLTAGLALYGLLTQGVPLFT